MIDLEGAVERMEARYAYGGTLWSNPPLAQDVRLVLDALKQARRMVKRLEWSFPGRKGYCPVCYKLRGTRHLPKCWLGRALYPENQVKTSALQGR